MWSNLFGIIYSFETGLIVYCYRESKLKVLPLFRRRPREFLLILHEPSSLLRWPCLKDVCYLFLISALAHQSSGACP